MRDCRLLGVAAGFTIARLLLLILVPSSLLDDIWWSDAILDRNHRNPRLPCE